MNRWSPRRRFIPKLPSDRYMAVLNYHLELEGKARIGKRDFVWLLSIIDRRRQRVLLHQFDGLELKDQDAIFERAQ